ncbi:hypothetical protein [Clostridium tetani]|uniref:hypothetical protein n=1 Tax=Clostridium tetani TaxID=1513 RepID=UPI002953F3E3|nr:hypothetical protein [Clostridium tetani]
MDFTTPFLLNSYFHRKYLYISTKIIEQVCYPIFYDAASLEPDYSVTMTRS